MSNCNNCAHKNDGCFCPPDKNCTAYEKEKVSYRFEFKTSDDWTPGEGACWAYCPFRRMIKFGDRYIYMKDIELECLFKGYLTKIEV